MLLRRSSRPALAATALALSQRARAAASESPPPDPAAAAAGHGTAATAAAAAAASSGASAASSSAEVNPLVSHLSVHAKRGPRAAMEDRWFVSDDLRFFGVFDGHGGHRVADYAMQHMYPSFVHRLRGGQEAVAEALRFAFGDVSDAVLGNAEFNMEGSTAVVVYIAPDVYVTANLGDSRAILCRGSQAVNLSLDHKPDAPGERARIEKLGGTVKWHGYLGPDRLPVVGMGAYRINGNLAVSRALGDKPERPFVSSEADVIPTPRKAGEDRFIIIASDGVWDVLTSQDAVDFVRQIMSGNVGGNRRSHTSRMVGGNQVKVVPARGPTSPPVPGAVVSGANIRAEMDTRKEKMAHYLVEEALRRGSADNVTAIVIWLN